MATVYGESLLSVAVAETVTTFNIAYKFEQMIKWGLPGHGLEPAALPVLSFEME